MTAPHKNSVIRKTKLRQVGLLESPEWHVAELKFGRKDMEKENVLRRKNSIKEQIYQQNQV